MSPGLVIVLVLLGLWLLRRHGRNLGRLQVFAAFGARRARARHRRAERRAMVAELADELQRRRRARDEDESAWLRELRDPKGPE